MTMNKFSARIFGIFFILSFLSYAVGTGLMDIVQTGDALPADIIAQKNRIGAGAILVFVFHTLFNIGLLAAMFRVVKPVNGFFSYSYLSAGLFGTFTLALGAVFMALTVPFSEQFAGLDNDNHLLFETVITLASKSNFYLYQAGMAVWGVGGLCLCYLLHQSGLVPPIFPIWGYAGYFIFVSGTFLELFGYPAGVLLSMPGGLFEIAMSVWLIVKGFKCVGSSA
jgi:hypothetical protein